MTRRQRFLSAIAHPQVAYLLLTLGILGLTVELWNPGAIAPGVAGGLALLLAFFAFQIVPVNTAGLLLILFGLGLLVLELKVPSFGVLGVGGVVSLLIGSIMMTRAVPGIRVGLGVDRARRPRPRRHHARPRTPGIQGAAAASRHRPQAMLGELGRARTPVTADDPGQVDVHGEIWRAVSRVPFRPGRRCASSRRTV